MLSLLPFFLIGLGMFVLGWNMHAWLTKPEEVLAPPQFTRWRCPKCERVKELPSELDRRVMVCNNCNVRLSRALESAT
ncbi:MAG TPA: hypothetical protein V6D47_21990 [Oscillatoriaceae cyanobacterium]